MKTRTKSILTVCLALALVASAVLGTIAYMTATEKKENTFTVGSFNKPTTDPDGKDLEEAAYLIEPSWKDNSKLLPGGSVAKDPMVGIAAGSEDAYIYVYVDNKILNADAKDNYVTFKLNDGWVAVDGETVAGKSEGTYVSGLFKYNTKLTAGSWTTEVFKTVDVADTANTTDFAANPQMIVHAYIHQAADGAGNDLANTAQTAAIAWAAGIKAGN